MQFQLRKWVLVTHVIFVSGPGGATRPVATSISLEYLNPKSENTVCAHRYDLDLVEVTAFKY